jgi:hypothetical protein
MLLEVDGDEFQDCPPLMLYNIPVPPTKGDPAIAFEPSLLIEVNEKDFGNPSLLCAQDCPPFILYHKPKPNIPAIAILPPLLLEERDKIAPAVTPDPPVDCDQFFPPFVLYNIPVNNLPPAIAFVQSSLEERQIKLSLVLSTDCVQELKLNKQGFVG